MIELYVNESEEMTFDMAIGGASEADAQVRLFIDMNELSLVFPGNVSNGTVDVKVPALDNVIKAELKDGDVFDARMEVVVSETTLTPWSGQVKIKKPVSVKLEMKEIKKVAEELKLDVKVGRPKVKVKPKVKEEKKVIEEEKKDEDKTPKKKSKLAERFE